MRIESIVWLASSLALASSPVAAQSQKAELTASDAAAQDQFGASVAVEGDWAVVGAPYDDDAVSGAGSAYVFHRVGGTWVEAQKLHAIDPESNGHFGSAVAISANTLVVGASHASVGQHISAGAVYVFELGPGDVWTAGQKLVASDAHAFADVGHAVSLDGDRLLAGAGGSAQPSEPVYVFERAGGPGSPWAEAARLFPSDPSFSFGASVAIEGDTAIVGSPFSQGPVLSAGAVYAFERGPTGWSETQRITASDPSGNAYFGISVALGDDHLLVGAQLVFAPGKVYAFDRTAQGWEEQQHFTALDTVDYDRFGRALAISGDTAAIGAHDDTDYGNSSGSAYVFRRTGSTWSQTGKMVARDAAAGDLLGISVAIEGGLALVGAVYDDSGCPGGGTCNAGSAYTFEFAPGAVQYGSCAINAPCGNFDVHGGCANSTGEGAIFAAFGTASAGADDLALEATALPPTTNAIVFMGGDETLTPLGDGLRCVAPGSAGLYRFPVVQADLQGRMQLGPGIVAASQAFPSAGAIQAGQAWKFQCWYRNPSGPCGQLTNLTNGVSVAFAP